LASELCQTIGDEFFFTLHSFLEVGKTQIFQVNFGKLLEMLLRRNLNMSEQVVNRTGLAFGFCLGLAITRMNGPMPHSLPTPG
jgi:hypothetical protein